MERLLQIAANLLGQSEFAYLSRNGHSRFSRVPILVNQGTGRYSHAPGYISLGKVRDAVPSNRTLGFSTKRSVKKVLHPVPEN